jgi:hypothetical protein
VNVLECQVTLCHYGVLCVDGWEKKFLIHFEFRLLHNKMCNKSRGMNTFWWHFSFEINTVVKKVRQHLFPLRRLKRFGNWPSDPQKVLQLHHWEHLDWLHHRLVWQLLGIWLDGATEGGTNCTVHHWGWPPCHLGLLFQAVSEEVQVNYHRPLRYRSAKTGTRRLLNSFYPQAIRLLIS